LSGHQHFFLATIDVNEKGIHWQGKQDSGKFQLNSATASAVEIYRNLHFCRFSERVGKREKGRSFLNSLKRANIYAIVWRSQTTKQSENTKKRIEHIFELLKKGEKLHQMLSLSSNSSLYVYDKRLDSFTFKFNRYIMIYR
jgi:hypothetical protein